MKFLQKKWNDKSFTETAYVVLSYEQLLQVNGAGGSSSGGGGPSGPSGTSGDMSMFQIQKKKIILLIPKQYILMIMVIHQITHM